MIVTSDQFIYLSYNKENTAGNIDTGGTRNLSRRKLITVMLRREAFGSLKFTGPC